MIVKLESLIIRLVVYNTKKDKEDNFWEKLQYVIFLLNGKNRGVMFERGLC
jgi:hypothetical protein